MMGREVKGCCIRAVRFLARVANSKVKKAGFPLLAAHKTAF